MNFLIYLAPLLPVLLKRELSATNSTALSSSSRGNGVLTVTRGPQITNYNHISTIDPVAVPPATTSTATLLIVIPVSTPTDTPSPTSIPAFSAAHIESSIGGDGTPASSGAEKSSQLPPGLAAWRKLWRRGDGGASALAGSTGTGAVAATSVTDAREAPVEERRRATDTSDAGCVQVMRSLEGEECDELAARYGMTWEQFRDSKPWLVECSSILVIERRCGGGVVNGTAADAAHTTPVSDTMNSSIFTSSSTLPNSSPTLDNPSTIAITTSSSPSSILAAGAAYMPGRALAARDYPTIGGVFPPVEETPAVIVLPSPTSATTAPPNPYYTNAAPTNSIMRSSLLTTILLAWTALFLLSLPLRAAATPMDSPAAAATNITDLSSAPNPPNKFYQPQGDPFNTYPNTAPTITRLPFFLPTLTLTWTVLFILSLPLRAAAAATTPTTDPSSNPTPTPTNQHKFYEPQGDPFNTSPNAAPSTSFAAPLLVCLALLVLALVLPTAGEEARLCATCAAVSDEGDGEGEKA